VIQTVVFLDFVESGMPHTKNCGVNASKMLQFTD